MTPTIEKALADFQEKFCFSKNHKYKPDDYDVRSIAGDIKAWLSTALHDAYEEGKKDGEAQGIRRAIEEINAMTFSLDYDPSSTEIIKAIQALRSLPH